MEYTEKGEVVVLMNDGDDAGTDRPACSMGLRDAVGCEATYPRHRRDIIAIPPTQATTTEVKTSPRNKFVGFGKSRNPTSRMSVSPNVSGRTGNVSSTSLP